MCSRGQPFVRQECLQDLWKHAACLRVLLTVSFPELRVSFCFRLLESAFMSYLSTVPVAAGHTGFSPMFSSKNAVVLCFPFRSLVRSDLTLFRV